VAAVSLRPAPRLAFPARADSNSPAHWVGDRLYVFNSFPPEGPRRSSGPDLWSLGDTAVVSFDRPIDGFRWLEATWPAEGRLYGWYHNEPRGVCPGTEVAATIGELTAPRIGAAVSEDNGATWRDLGLVLLAREGSVDCGAENGYFSGGHGDLCVFLDREEEFLYLFYGSYGGEAEEQGVAVARMAWRDRDDPVGRVWKWYEGGWREPGLGGRLTPTFPVFVPWQRADCNAFWGPSVHWNEHLGSYAMLLNRTKGKGWVQEGIYVSFASNVADPGRWSGPVKILDGGAWYPQVVGVGEGVRGTDKLAGRVARLFLAGVSEHEIVFEPDE